LKEEGTHDMTTNIKTENQENSSKKKQLTHKERWEKFRKGKKLLFDTRPDVFNKFIFPDYFKDMVYEDYEDFVIIWTDALELPFEDILKQLIGKPCEIKHFELKGIKSYKC